MMINCRNCKKIFYAKNALFCSTSCYEFYRNAIERNVMPPLEESANHIDKIDSSVVLRYEQKSCNHEYSKNGTMSCRKCGHTSVLIK